MKKISVDPSKYVVLDVETNGLNSMQDDLLSISIYRPDDGKEYDKFLPLDLNRKVYTTEFNGITKQDLEGATHLNQEAFDELVEDFDLNNRTILIYEGRYFDKTFLKNYMRRHNIKGIEKLNFQNIKRQILSPAFSTGNLTKDNFCALFGIKDIPEVHHGLNDCKLEWELFKRMDGDYYLVTEDKLTPNDNIFKLNDDYLMPASFLYSHPNVKKFLTNRPYIECESKLIKTFEIKSKYIQKFPTNFNGITIENLINKMLNVDEQNNAYFLQKNKMKLDYIGKIPNNKEIVETILKGDGTVEMKGKKNKKLEKEINNLILDLKKQIGPLVEYIKYSIFDGEHITSQELVIDEENKILALCDLSTKDAVLEIKTNSEPTEKYKEQLFYESDGRKTYHLRMLWVTNINTFRIDKIIFEIYSVDVHKGIPGATNWTEGKRAENRTININKIQSILQGSSIELAYFENMSSPLKLYCKNCGEEWNIKYPRLEREGPHCPKCNPIIKTKKEVKTPLSNEEKLKIRSEKYYEKVQQRSNSSVFASNYVGSKEYLTAKCGMCGYEWKIRADHLLSRCFCPNCKKRGFGKSNL